MKRILWALATGLLPVIVIGAGPRCGCSRSRARAQAWRKAPATLAAHGEHTGTVNTAAVVVQVDDRRSVVRWVDFHADLHITTLELAGLEMTVGETSFWPHGLRHQGRGLSGGQLLLQRRPFLELHLLGRRSVAGLPRRRVRLRDLDDGGSRGWRWGAFGSAQTPAEQAIAAVGAVEWLRSQQSPTTGGFGDSAGAAVEVLMALGANHEQPADWRPSDLRTLDQYLLTHATRFSRDNVAAATKWAVGAAASDACQPVRSVTPSFYFSDTLGASRRMRASTLGASSARLRSARRSQPARSKRCSASSRRTAAGNGRLVLAPTPTRLRSPSR